MASHVQSAAVLSIAPSVIAASGACFEVLVKKPSVSIGIEHSVTHPILLRCIYESASSLSPQRSTMLSARVMITLACVALSVVGSCVEATGRVLRSDCPDYDGSAASAATPSSAAASTSNSGDTTTDSFSASASNSSETETPESTAALVLVDVTLYDQAAFAGDSYSFSVTTYDDCYELDCFDHATMSAQWTSKDFEYFGFYLTASCGGGGAPQYVVFTDDYSVSAMQNYTFKSVRLFQTESSSTSYANAVSTCPSAAT